MALGRARRAALSALCAAAVLSACTQQTTPAASTPPSTPTTAATNGAGGLIVSVEEVRRIANYDELTAHEHADLHQPPSGDLNAPGPCRAAGTSDLTFASGWTEFRSAGYSGVTDDTLPGGIALVDTVSQAVAIYPDSRAARTALEALETSLNACVALRDPKYDFRLDKPDATTLRITDNGWSHQYRIKNSVLMSVGVLGIEPAERISTDILSVITDRIK